MMCRIISDDPNKHKSTGAGSQMLSGLFQVWWGCRCQSYMLQAFNERLEF